MTKRRAPSFSHREKVPAKRADEGLEALQNRARPPHPAAPQPPSPHGRGGAPTSVKPTYAQALTEGRAALKSHWIDNPDLDARLLLSHAASIDMAGLIARGDDKLPEVEYRAFKDHLKRRSSGEPVARVLGEAEFYGLSLHLSPSTLVPRPETETLVDVVLNEARDRFPPKVSICDLGTGTGAIAIALLANLPEARATATDISEEALSTAMLNAERHEVRSRLTFQLADFADGPEGPFDIVVSNPPYIRSGDIAGLDPPVRIYDPQRALDGGADGLAAYRAILGRIDTLLNAGGLLAFEIGHDQGEAVMQLCQKAGLAEVRIEQDLARRDRVVVARGGLAEQAETPGNVAKKALGEIGVTS